MDAPQRSTPIVSIEREPEPRPSGLFNNNDQAISILDGIRERMRSFISLIMTNFHVCCLCFILIICLSTLIVLGSCWFISPTASHHHYALCHHLPPLTALVVAIVMIIISALVLHVAFCAQWQQDDDDLVEFNRDDDERIELAELVTKGREIDLV